MRPCILWMTMGACLIAQAPSRLAGLEEQVQTAPDRAIAMVTVASACVKEGSTTRALHWLREIVDLKAGINPSQLLAASALQADPEYARIAARAKGDNPPIVQSRTAFTIADRELIPEGLAWDPQTRALYLGSLYKQKIVEIAPDGTARDFVASGQDGLGRVLGMKVDPRTRTLWVASGTKGQSGLFRFDLKTGRLIRKYLLEGNHLLNDLVVTTAGDVYATDSNQGAVYWISRAADELTELLPGVTFRYTNGIALSGNEKKLYVAAWPAGIMVVDLVTKTTGPLAHAPGITLIGVDGLYFHDGALLAIQNAAMFPRVVRLKLAAGQDRVEAMEILEREHPLYALPTTGAVADRTFYYIANSQLDHLPEDELQRPETLRPIVILALDLPLAKTWLASPSSTGPGVKIVKGTLRRNHYPGNWEVKD